MIKESSQFPSKLDGMEVLRRFRMENEETPVLVLSVRGQIRDKVEGLDAGANDYLVKPFADKSRSRAMGGAGLGLAQARQTDLGPVCHQCDFFAQLL